MSTSEEEKHNTPTTEQSDAAIKALHPRYLSTLVVGDVLVFLVFAAIGQQVHHGEAVSLDTLLQIALTAAPFAAGWFIIAPFVGAYRADIVTQPRMMALRTAFTWLLAWPVGLTLRGIFVDHGAPLWPFALVTLVFIMLVLLVWRWPFALTRSLRKG